MLSKFEALTLCICVYVHKMYSFLKSSGCLEVLWYICDSDGMLTYNISNITLFIFFADRQAG